MAKFWNFLMSTAAIWVAFSIAAAATVFDGISSWQIIELNPIALEGNPLWSSIGSTWGFGGAMILRGAVGISLLGVLIFLALRSKRHRVRSLAAFGLYFSAAVLSLLTAYHIWFRLIYG